MQRGTPQKDRFRLRRRSESGNSDVSETCCIRYLSDRSPQGYNSAQHVVILCLIGRELGLSCVGLNILSLSLSIYIYTYYIQMLDAYTLRVITSRYTHGHTHTILILLLLAALLLLLLLLLALLLLLLVLLVVVLFRCLFFVFIYLYY